MIFTLNTIAAVATLLTTTTALPTLDLKPLASPPTEGTFMSETVSKRGPTDVFGDYTGSWSSFSDGEGTYVRSDDVHKYGDSGDKCWTDLFYVYSSPGTTAWVKQAEVDCATTSECDAGIEGGVETCSETSITVEAGFEFNIIKDILGISASTSTTNSESQCEHISNVGTCHWDDSGCHSVWTSQSVMIDHGYIRRRCDFHDGKGDVTVWSKDMDVNQKATGVHLGCKASCDASYYS